MSQLGRFNRGSGGIIVETLTGDSGGAVSPDASYNIDVLGGDHITTVGDPGTNTLTINLDDDIAETYTTDSGDAIPAAGVLNILGSGGLTTSGAGNTVTILPDGTIATQYDGNTGSAVPSSDILNVVVDNVNAGTYTDTSTATFVGSGNTLELRFTDEFNSTGLGQGSLASQTGGVNTGSNTAIGFACLTANTTGSNNTAMGSVCGTAVTTGGNNALFGFQSGYSITEGNDNVCLGIAAGRNFTTGSRNVIIGSTDDEVDPFTNSAGYNYASSESNNICIGNPGVVGDNNTIRIGTTGSGAVQQDTCYIAGIDGVNVGSVAEVVTMGTGGAADQLGTAVITAGSGITVTPGANTITISATGADLLAYTAVNTTPYVVLTADEFLGVDSSGAPITIQLPNAPDAGRVYYIKDATGSAAGMNITVTTVGGVVTIDGATTFVMNTAYESVNVLFDGTGYLVF